LIHITFSIPQAEVIEKPVEIMSIIIGSKFNCKTDLLTRNVYIHSLKPKKVTNEITNPAKSPTKKEDKCQYDTETSGCRITGQ
jgi:hypothetical protein